MVCSIFSPWCHRYFIWKNSNYSWKNSFREPDILSGIILVLTKRFRMDRFFLSSPIVNFEIRRAHHKWSGTEQSFCLIEFSWTLPVWLIQFEPFQMPYMNNVHILSLCLLVIKSLSLCSSHASEICWWLRNIETRR